VNLHPWAPLAAATDRVYTTKKSETTKLRDLTHNSSNTSSTWNYHGRFWSLQLVRPCLQNNSTITQIAQLVLLHGRPFSYITCGLHKAVATTPQSWKSCRKWQHDQMCTPNTFCCPKMQTRRSRGNGLGSSSHGGDPLSIVDHLASKLQVPVPDIWCGNPQFLFWEPHCRQATNELYCEWPLIENRASSPPRFGPFHHTMQRRLCGCPGRMQRRSPIRKSEKLL